MKVGEMKLFGARANSGRSTVYPKASIAARIEIALFCLPNAPYREMMRVLFEDMATEYNVQSKAADHWLTEATKTHNNAVRLEDNAERYRWLSNYFISDDTQYDNAIVAAATVSSLNSVIDAIRETTTN
jgi:hypothetical protein